MALMIPMPLCIPSQLRGDTNCKSELRWVSHYEQADKGWVLDFIDRSRVLGTGPYQSAGREATYSYVAFGVKKKVIVLPGIQVNACNDSAILSNIYVLPDTVMQISKGNRVFAYRVAGDLVRGPLLNSGGAGGSGIFMLYDVHGTGRIDGLEIFIGSKPLDIPDWVKQLPPSP